MYSSAVSLILKVLYLIYKRLTIAFMESYLDCIEVIEMNFSEKSTVSDPIIYVWFKENNAITPFSKKEFKIKEM